MTPTTGARLSNLLFSVLLCALCMTMGQRKVWPVVLFMCIFAIVPVVYMQDDTTIIYIQFYVPQGQVINLTLSPPDSFIVVESCEQCSNINTQFDCDLGYYMNGDNCYSCTPISNCNVTVQCTGTGNSVCNACDDGFYWNNQACVACDSRCALCSGPNNNQCKACADGYHLVNGTTCVPCSGSCSATQYISSACGSYADRICSPCSPPCATCENRLICNSCLPGTYQTGKMCQACDPSCATCTGPAASVCGSCAAGFYLSGTTCLPCSATCATCSGSANSCTSCPSGSYQSGTTCASCDPSCNGCTGASSTACVECALGYTSFDLSAGMCATEADYWCDWNSGDGFTLNSPPWPVCSSSPTMAEICAITGNEDVTCSTSAQGAQFVTAISFTASSNIIGTIPDTLQYVSAELASLTITNTGASGLLPTSLSTLSKLTLLILNNNQFSGAIPQLSNLLSLTLLDLSDNSGLIGTIPTGLVDSTSLQNIKIQGTGVTGTIPAFTQDVTITGGQNLCGPVPPTVTITDDNGAAATVPNCTGSTP